jgi:hypothetical protein
VTPKQKAEAVQAALSGHVWCQFGHYGPPYDDGSPYDASEISNPYGICEDCEDAWTAFSLDDTQPAAWHSWDSWAERRRKAVKQL